MTWIDLGDPLPRLTPKGYEPLEWKLGEACSLPVPNEALAQPFSEVLDARTSLRQFSAVHDQQLGTFLWHACRTRGVGPSNLGFTLEHRAAPSAGAIHPIHLIVRRPNEHRWFLYKPNTHQLVELICATERLAGLYEFSLQVLGAEEATRILFLAEPGKTLGKYKNGSSLVWRDAGVLLGIMALTATAQGLNFCPLGITGEPWASALADKGKLAGVGLALLGSSTGV